eukprot:scaffold15299_cov23-Cyclotella_meneghiniana.AAC.2
MGWVPSGSAVPGRRGDMESCRRRTSSLSLVISSAIVLGEISFSKSSSSNTTINPRDTTIGLHDTTIRFRDATI